MYKVIVAFFIATCVVVEDVLGEDSHCSQTVQSGVYNNFTINQYIGKWLMIAQIHPLYADSEILVCDSMEIEKDSEHSGYFNENYRKYSVDGGVATMLGNGRVVESKIYFMPSEFLSRMRVLIPQSYDNGNDLILIDEAKKENSKLISRHYPASLQARAEFERFAGEISSQVFYFKHDTNCRSH